LTNHNPFTSWLQGFLKGDFLKWKFHWNQKKYKRKV
jgi:hypothetical protein